MTTELVEKYAMLPRGSRVLCAVSGGADSVCLLHFLWTNRERFGIAVAAAHYEHGIRGEESRRDAEFVSDFCRRLGIECIVGHGNVTEYAKAHSLGTEEAARTLRYAFLEKTASERGFDRIATAHNADDNAETMLLNLTRGTGLNGLGGIPPVRGSIVRPLLDVTRAEIEAYLAENDLPHVEDSSNGSDEYSRNLLRHRVLPVLRELNGKAAQSILRASELARQDEDFLRQSAREFIAQYYKEDSIPVSAFSRLHTAVASRVVRELCPKSLSEAHVAAVLSLREGTERRKLDLPGIRLRREQGRIYFGEEECAGLPDRELIAGEILRIPEAGIRISAEFSEFSEEINDLFKTFLFKSESICGKMFVTQRKNGDRLRPAGRGCTKTLKALFAEAGMTERERALTPVLRDEHGVLAVVGMAADERTVPQRGDRVLKIQIEKE